MLNERSPNFQLIPVILSIGRHAPFFLASYKNSLFLSLSSPTAISTLSPCPRPMLYNFQHMYTYTPSVSSTQSEYLHSLLSCQKMLCSFDNQPFVPRIKTPAAAGSTLWNTFSDNVKSANLHMNVEGHVIAFVCLYTCTAVCVCVISSLHLLLLGSCYAVHINALSI